MGSEMCIRDSSQGKDEYQCRVTVEATTETLSRSVAGTLISNRPRLIDVKGIALESELGTHMLYMTNEDTPGVVGAIGTTAGDQGINIANLHLGRSEAGGVAIALVEIDATVSDEQLALLRDVPGITDVSYLHFPQQG